MFYIDSFTAFRMTKKGRCCLLVTRLLIKDKIGIFTEGGLFISNIENKRKSVSSVVKKNQSLNSGLPFVILALNASIKSLE